MEHFTSAQKEHKVTPENPVTDFPLTTNPMRKFLLPAKAMALTLILLFSASFITYADTHTWTPTTGGAWTTSGNWSSTGGGTPSAGDDVIISSAQTGNITAVPTISLNSLTVNGTCTFIPGSSGNTLTVSGLTVANGIIFTIASSSGRLIFTLTGTGNINGNGQIVYNGTIGGGTFTVSGDLTIAPDALLTGNSYSTFALNSGATLRIGSTVGITSSGSTGNVQTNTRNFSTGANYIYNGSAAQVTGNGLTQNTPANLTINNSNGVTLSAATTISGLLTMTSGTLNMADLALTVGSLTGSSNITLSTSGTTARTLTIGSDNTNRAAYSGVISNTTNGTAATLSLTKNGTGTLTLSGANTYTGLTTVSVGVIDVQNNTGLGTTAGATTVASGAAIQVDGNGLNIAEPISSIIGTGISSGGALRNLANSNTWSGAITLGTGGARINSDAGTLTITGGVTGSGLALTIGGSGNTTFSTAAIGTAAGTVTKDGSGTLTMNVASTYTGGTTLKAGTLNINNSAGLGTTAGTFTIEGGTIDNTSGSDITTLNYPLALNGDFTYSGSVVPRNLNLGTGAVSFNANRQITVTAGTLTIGGTISAESYNLTKADNGTFSFGSNPVTLNGLTISAGTLISTSGTMSLAADFTNNAVFSHNNGTVTFNGSNAANIQGTAGTGFYDLTINKNAPTTTVTNPSTTPVFGVSHILTITSGNLVLLSHTGGDYLVTNNLIVSTSGKLTNVPTGGPNRLCVTGSVLIDGAYDLTIPSELQMRGNNTSIHTGSTALSMFSFAMFGDNVNGTITADGTVTVNGNFNVSNSTPGGTFKTNGNDVFANGGLNFYGGTFEVNGGTLTVQNGMNVGLATYSGHAIVSSGTLTTNALSIGDGTTGTGIFEQTGGTVNINGDLVIRNNGTYTCTNSPTINTTGDWTNNGTFTPAYSTVNFNGSTQAIGGTTSFYNLTVSSGTTTFGASRTISNNLSINAGAKADLTDGSSSTANKLFLGGVGQSAGKWGSTAATTANYQNDVYFNNPSTGIVTISSSDCTAGTWLGTTSTDWNDGSNWCGGVPTSAIDVTIPTGSTVHITSTAASPALCRDLTVNGALIVDAGKALSVYGSTFNPNGKLTIESDALTNSGSLIYYGSGTPFGNVTYNRQFRTDNGGDYDNHLMSSPVTGALPTFSDNSVTVAFYKYEEASNTWPLVTTPLTPGIGYSMEQATGSSGKYAFTGTIVTSDFTVTPTYTSTGGDGWNLLGNPFTSAMDVTATTNGFLGTTTGNIEKLFSSYYAIYIYDNGYYKYIAASPPVWQGIGGLSQTYIQVGQGFFVCTTASTLSFNKNMQAHVTNAPLKKAETPWPGLELKVKYGNNENSTLIVYNGEMTSGLDPGYDVGQLSAGPDVEIYTALVQDNGINFARQALPLADYDKNVVSVGITSEKGGPVTFSAVTVPIGNGTFYLEDRITGTYTDLSKDSYSVTLPAKTSGTGRFYIHASVVTGIQPQLSDPNLLGVRIWASYNKVNIEGAVSSKAVGAVYDMLGRKIFETRLTDSNLNTIDVPTAVKGVYIVKITDGMKMCVQKVVF